MEDLNIKDKLKITGKLVLEVYDADTFDPETMTGKLIETIVEDNLITNYGQLQLLDDASAIDTLAVGSGVSTPAYGDTDLDTQITMDDSTARLARTSVAIAAVSGGGVNGSKSLTKFTVTRTQGCGVAGTCATGVSWNELGMFLADTGSTCCTRVKLSSPFTKDNTKTVVASWTITFSP